MAKDRKLKQHRPDARRHGFGLWIDPGIYPRTGRAVFGFSGVVAAACLLSLPVLSVEVRAQSGVPADETKTLRTTEEALKNARERAAELTRNARLSETELAALRQRLIAVAARAHDQADTVQRLERRMAELIKRESAKKASLQAQRGRLSSLIAALQRIAAHPPTALIALPAAPADTIRSALLLRGTVPAIEGRARILAGDLDALAELRTALVGARVQLDAERKTLQQDRAALEGLVARKSNALMGTQAAQKKATAEAARLGREASSLRDLVRRLESARNAKRQQEAREEAARKKAELERKTMEAQTRLREAQTRQQSARPQATPPSRQQSVIAALPPPDVRKHGLISRRSGNLPVPGRIVGKFGAAKDGAPSDGVTVTSQPGAAVIAPSGGTVVFAGPFKGLGKLLIIEHRGAYHLLLAGLARIDASIGEKVLAGEPVGVMPLTGSTDPTLYMELRRGGRPVNPTPWLAARRNRKNG